MNFSSSYQSNFPAKYLKIKDAIVIARKIVNDLKFLFSLIKNKKKNINTIGKTMSR